MVKEIQELLLKHLSPDGAYLPLDHDEFRILRSELERLLDNFENGNSDQKVECISGLIILILSHFDSIQVLMEKSLDALPIEVVRAIASSIFLDSGYFGEDPIVSLLFTPSSQDVGDRMHTWDRLKVPQIGALCKSFMMRIDVPEEILTEIEQGIGRLERY